LLADTTAIAAINAAEASQGNKASYGLFHGAAAACPVAGTVSWEAAAAAAHFGALASSGNNPYDRPDYPLIASERTAEAAILRDIFGNSFCLVTSVAGWLNTNIVALAQAIYDERAFGRMPILADALEDAGCTDASILEHCRGGGVHARGCWVVDLVLGKE